MTHKRLFIFFAALATLIFAACQPQVDTAPAVESSLSMETAAPAGLVATATLKTILRTPILEAVTPSPQAEVLEEFSMSEKDRTPSPNPEDEETGAAPDAARSQPTPVAEYPVAVQPFIDMAIKDLSERQDLAGADITVVSFETKVWPDSSLGCPQPGMRYLQVLKEGYLIRLSAGGEIFNYHGGEGRDPFLCEQPGPEIKVTKQPPLELNRQQTPTKSVPPPRD